MHERMSHRNPFLLSMDKMMDSHCHSHGSRLLQFRVKRPKENSFPWPMVDWTPSCLLKSIDNDTFGNCSIAKLLLNGECHILAELTLVSNFPFIYDVQRVQLFGARDRSRIFSPQPVSDGSKTTNIYFISLLGFPRGVLLQTLATGPLRLWLNWAL